MDSRSGVADPSSCHCEAEQDLQFIDTVMQQLRPSAESLATRIKSLDHLTVAEAEMLIREIWARVS